MAQVTKFLNSAIIFSLFALTVVTPLLFTTQTSELFEVPKMYFVYFFACTILALTLIKFFLEKKITLPRNIIIIIFIIFITVQVASTLTSIDKFTSIFGYPSRLNGGLLSNFAYLAILFGALVNLPREFAKRLIKVMVIGAFAVALWGIPGHFGYDPNCLVLTGNLNANCWQKEFDPTLRIFSTQGQPNWLAAYLILTIPFAAALTQSAKNLQKKYIWGGILTTLFIALVFTNSRAGFLGLAASLFAFLAMLGFNKVGKNIKIIIIAIVIFIISLGTFGKSLALRFYQTLNPPTQSAGGTESAAIRLIVWEGAVKILQKKPILGTGPETFAYAYYKVRPPQHNKTTEWNFFYNKAHNEILNILANSGILGGLSYLVFLGAVLLVFFKGSKSENDGIFAKAGIASILGYQTSIFFGFSTVTSQLLMLLQIATILILTNQNQMRILNLKFIPKTVVNLPPIVLGLLAIYAFAFVARLLLADILITLAKAKDSTNPQTLLIYTNAAGTSPIDNPFHLADAAYSFALYSQALDDKGKALSFADQADNLAQRAQIASPQNILVARKLASVYILLFSVDPKFERSAEDLGQKIVNLAPTDPQSYVSAAKVKIGLGKEKEAKVFLEKALELKGDYVEALELLDSVNKQLTTKK